MLVGARARASSVPGVSFQIPDGIRRELEEKGWDGVTLIPPEDEQVELALDAEREPDADLDAIFGTLPEPGDNRIGGFHALDSGAPETERLAAIRVYPKTGTARRKVLDLIAERGERGATAEECSLELGLRLYTAAPRLTELKGDGWIEDSGRTRRTTAGADAAVFVLTAAGRAQHRAA